MIGQSMLPAVIPPRSPAIVPEHIPASQPGIGAGNGDFRRKFLDLMEEAGEILGRTAAKRFIADTRGIVFGVQGSGGGANPTPTPTDPKTPRLSLSQANVFAAHSFRQLVDQSRMIARFTRDTAKMQGWSPMQSAKAGMAAGAVAGAVGLPSATYFTGRAMANQQRQYADVSPSLAANYMISDMRKMIREMRLGQGIAGTNREMLAQLDRMSSHLAIIEKFVTNTANIAVASIVRPMNNILDWIKERFGIKEDAAGLNLWAGALQAHARDQELNDQDRRRIDPNAIRENGGVNIPPEMRRQPGRWWRK